MTIRIYSITLKIFLVIILGLSPIWVLIPVKLGVQMDNKQMAIILSVVLLICSIIIAHIFARKKTNLTITDKEVKFRKTTILIESIHNIKINKTGIGMSAIEFYTITGEKHSFNFPNYKENADKAISFVKNHLTEINISEREYY